MLQHTTTIIVGFKYFNNDNTNGATPYSIDTCEVGICPSFQFLSIWPKLKPLLNTQRIQRKQGVAFGRMFLCYCLPPVSGQWVTVPTQGHTKFRSAK